MDFFLDHKKANIYFDVEDSSQLVIYPLLLQHNNFEERINYWGHEVVNDFQKTSSKKLPDTKSCFI